MDIINAAMARIGGPRLVSLDGDNTPSRVARHVWDIALDATLRSNDWWFARKRAPLALLANKPLNSSFAYHVPQDCLAVRKVLPSVDAGPDEPGAPHRMENVDGFRAIVCSIQNAVLEYTFRVTDCEVFDAYFTDALAWRLAGDLAMGLKSDTELGSAGIQLAERIKNTAATVNARETGFVDDIVSSFEQARYS